MSSPGNGVLRCEQAWWGSSFPRLCALLLVNVGKPGFGGLFTYASNYMVNATVCVSDTQIKLAKIVPAKQTFLCTDPRNTLVFKVFINLETQLLLDFTFQKYIFWTVVYIRYIHKPIKVESFRVALHSPWPCYLPSCAAGGKSPAVRQCGTYRGNTSAVTEMLRLNFFGGHHWQLSWGTFETTPHWHGRIKFTK